VIQALTLNKYSLFGGLLKEQIESIIPLMEIEKYESDHNIITEGQPNDKIFFLVDGSVVVIKKGIVLTNFKEGAVFGEMEVLDVMPAVATIKSITPVTVMSISNISLHEIYKIDIKAFSLIIMNMARDLSRRLRRMDELLVTEPGNVV
jgi:CRP-like cAMP-binding protein